MPILWIIINLFDLHSPLILIFVDMQYKLNGANISIEAFAKMIAIMNSIAMSHFFETMCYGIFVHLLAIGSKNRRLFSSISTYFGIVKTNNQGILYLHCLVWLCDVFHITQFRK